MAHYSAMLPVVAILLIGPAVSASDQSWPYWGGPNHNFKCESKGLANVWPEGGPRRIWTRDLGEDGYSGVAYENGKLYTMFRRGTQEVVVALQARTGKTVWEHTWDAPFRNDFAEKVGPGPYAMPQLFGDRVFVAGATGKIRSLKRENGEPVWQHDVYQEFNGTRLIYGYACHALPYKNTLILLVGGPGTAVMAFDQATGRVIWARHTFKNAYSSPVLINVDGQDQVVGFMANEVIGVDPNSGELLWSFPHTAQLGLVVSMPVWGPGNLLFFSSCYNGGGTLLHLTRSEGKTKVEQAWHTNRVDIHFGSIIWLGDYIYASSGRGPAFLTAVEAKTGAVAWQTREFAKAQILLADGKFIILDEDGNLGLATPSPQGLQIHAKAPLLKQFSWTLPTLVGTQLYLRDRKSIMALELGRIVE